MGRLRDKLIGKVVTRVTERIGDSDRPGIIDRLRDRLADDDPDRGRVVVTEGFDDDARPIVVSDETDPLGSFLPIEALEFVRRWEPPPHLRWLRPAIELLLMAWDAWKRRRSS